MADNETTGTGKAVATDKVTYSGDADQNVQLVRFVQVTGSEGSKTVVNLPGDATDGLLVNLGSNNDVTVTSISAGDNNIGNVDIASIAAGDNNIGNVDIVTMPNVTNGGTFVVQENGAALTALQLIDDPVFADDAGFTAATSKVMMQGVYVVAVGAAPDQADANDAAAPIATRNRVQFTLGGDPATITVKHANITTAVTDTAIITVGTGNKIVVTSISVSLDNASTVFPTVLIGFGSANTPTTTGVIFAHGGFPAGGQASRGDGSGVLGIGADGEDLRITTTGNATGNGLQVVVSYHLLPS